MAFKLPFFPRLDRAALAGAGQGQALESAVTVEQPARTDAVASATPPVTQAPASTGADAAGESRMPNLLERLSDRRLPVLGGLPVAQQIRALLSVLGIAFLLGVLFGYLNSRSTTQSALQTQIAGDALMHSQRIGKAAPNAIQGCRPAA